VKGKT
jgi:hypothetical protein